MAIVLGWLFGYPPLRTFHFDLRDTAVGLAATLPPLAIFWICLKTPLGPLERIAVIMDETLLPLFRGCSVVQLAIIAALAGVGEEMLFRGIVQTAVAETIDGQHGIWLGLLAAATVFGLLHPITPTYAILAVLIGGYLGWLWLFYGNLLVPIVAHASYDFVALVYLLKARRTAGSRE